MVKVSAWELVYEEPKIRSSPATLLSNSILTIPDPVSSSREESSSLQEVTETNRNSKVDNLYNDFILIQILRLWEILHNGLDFLLKLIAQHWMVDGMNITKYFCIGL